VAASRPVRLILFQFGESIHQFHCSSHSPSCTAIHNSYR